MFKLPELPYSYSALEPYIDEITMQIHHAKHHQAYVDNLNKALELEKTLLDYSTDKLLVNLDKVPEGVRQTVVNNAGGHANHSFFWQVMNPKKLKINDKFSNELAKYFGTLDDFKLKFTEKAMTVFGSGWAFLILTKDKKLELKRHSFQNSPLMKGNIPILGIDVWEHAYYLKYQNKRKDYIDAWWNIVNWQQVEENFNKAVKL
jgi:superoxide dismutase, Fe-Mn family